MIEFERLLACPLARPVELDLQKGVLLIGQDLFRQREVLMILGVGVFPKHWNVLANGLFDLIRLTRSRTRRFSSC